MSLPTDLEKLIIEYTDLKIYKHLININSKNYNLKEYYKLIKEQSNNFFIEYRDIYMKKITEIEKSPNELHKKNRMIRIVNNKIIYQILKIFENFGILEIDDYHNPKNSVLSEILFLNISNIEILNKTDSKYEHDLFIASLPMANLNDLIGFKLRGSRNLYNLKFRFDLSSSLYDNDECYEMGYRFGYLLYVRDEILFFATDINKYFKIPTIEELGSLWDLLIYILNTSGY